MDDECRAFEQALKSGCVINVNLLKGYLVKLRAPFLDSLKAGG